MPMSWLRSLSASAGCHAMCMPNGASHSPDSGSRRQFCVCSQLQGELQMAYVQEFYQVWALF